MFSQNQTYYNEVNSTLNCFYYRKKHKNISISFEAPVHSLLNLNQAVGLEISTGVCHLFAFMLNWRQILSFQFVFHFVALFCAYI